MKRRLAVAAILAGAVAAAVMGWPRPRAIPAPDLAVEGAATTITARDGARLFVRGSAQPGPLRALLLHGGNADSREMLPLRAALSAAGIEAWAPDLRGHRHSGRHEGTLDRPGQLDDDLSDLMVWLAATHGAKATGLVGFSAGGGLALRTATGPHSASFTRFVLLAPNLGADPTLWAQSPTGWLRVDGTVASAADAIDRLGLLPLRWQGQTWRLISNQRPIDKWPVALGKLDRRATVILGTDDRVFNTEAMADAFRRHAPAAAIRVLTDLGHQGLVSEPRALEAIIAALRD